MGCMDSGGSGSTQNSQSQSYTEAQKEWLEKMLDMYGPRAGGYEAYQGDRVASFSDLQNDVLSKAGNFLSTFSSPQTVSTPLLKETGNSIAKLLSGDTGAQKITQEQTDDYFTKNIKDPTMRLLKDDLLPTIDESYTGGNFFSSARGKARDNMTTDIANQLISEKAQLNWDVNQNNQALDEAKANRTLSTLSPAMQYGQVPVQETLNNLQIAASQVEGLTELFGIGSEEQTQEQKQLAAQMAQFMEDNQITDPQDIAIILSLLGMSYSSSSSSGDSSSWGSGLGYNWLSPG